MSCPVLAIDPGREKCGVAVLAADGHILVQEIVQTEALTDVVGALAAAYEPTIIMGNGTTSAEARTRIEALGATVTLVDEYRTTDGAKQLYWEVHPPCGWRRLVPRGMLVPPAPVDDFVAVILARRFLNEQIV
ncbi:pre-16S rRNA-processing nuclease YqgF [uncultured Selenomonas sp.]|uniref:pre-16S rRNA-processing nuclease YqgF n=1 Tax=uncultured Selenomonas sp. TaxID=159275 RepID=UPI0028E1F2CF|nr:pre-16S rRNA-processing nuclease YqgF [uncultured Selenomonas sp.]